jgi:hypothetical protein
MGLDLIFNGDHLLSKLRLQRKLLLQVLATGAFTLG